MSSSTNTDPNHPALPRGQILALAAAVEGGMLATAFLLGWMTGVRFWEGVEIGVRAVGYAVAFTAPLLVIFAAAARASTPMFTRIRQDLDLILPMFRNCTVPDLLLMSLLAGAGEEALFRGVLQPIAVDALGAVAGLIVVSALFGLVHLISIPYAIFAAGMGLYLGAIHLWSDNLFVAAATHALYDFVALVYLLRVATKESNVG